MKNSEQRIKSGTTDKFEGLAKIASGSVKEQVGKIVSSRRLKDQGRAEKVEGRIQNKVGEIKRVFGQ